MKRMPQVLQNVRVKQRIPLSEMPDIARLIADVEQRLGESGRLLVRYSGTEMLARVMVEGADQAQIGAFARGYRRHCAPRRRVAASVWPGRRVYP